MRNQVCALLLAAALGAAPAAAAGRDFGACLQLLRRGLPGAESDPAFRD